MIENKRGRGGESIEKEKRTQSDGDGRRNGEKMDKESNGEEEKRRKNKGIKKK